VRVAHVYSIVVNSRGHEFAECMEVHDLHGTRFSRRVTCEIEVVDGHGTEHATE